ncbi:metal ABC transporter ATP-binding protein [Georgenia wangjunii]|uniref:metal ABC transporter ATP-binding protein n=1 Tax=Georgenia wangjunii TaxID=3117730 RepID=UPI002F2654CE
MSAAGVVLEVEDLVVRYGDVLALDGATLRLGAGRVCGLVGVNGSGKSTLLKAVMGTVRADAGRVRLLGGTPEQARRRAAIAWVPQSEDVDWAFPLSVRDVVMTGRFGHLGMTRRPRRADHDAVTHALGALGLDDLAGRQIGELSGGQRKRVFVARALAQEARIMLLDEPFGGVDAVSQATITTILRDLAAQGTSALVATHDLAGLRELCDEAVLLHRRVLAHDTPAEILRPEVLALAFGDVGPRVVAPARTAPTTEEA